MSGTREIARAASAAPRRGEDPGYLRTKDPSAIALANKLRKHYKTKRSIELLCYFDGRVVSADDQVLCALQSMPEVVNGPFRRVWYLARPDVRLR